MKRVLVLDACQRSALAVTRSLGKHGVPVITADETQTSLAGSSRFSIKNCTHHSARLNPIHFIDDIINICRKHSIDIIFPMTELTTNLLLQHRSHLSNIILPFPDLDTVDKIADKCSLLRLAKSLDIPIPRTKHFDYTSQVQVIDDSTAYPIVLKPGKSWVKSNDEWLHTSVRFADDRDQAKTIISTDEAFSAYPFMLQEKVPGQGQGIFALYDHGVPMAFFAHRRIREKPPSGGVSVLSESVEINPVLLNYAKKLLDSADWHGIAMVEFKCDDHHNCYLMEINTRFWVSLQLAVDAGVDFPWLLYQITCGDKVNAIDSYTKGTRLRWLLGDLDRLYILIKSRQVSLINKLLNLLVFAKPSPFTNRHETNRIGDMGPFWWELRQYFNLLFK